MTTKSPPKAPFDKSSFVFKTPLAKIQEFIDKIESQLDDDEQGWPIEQETYLYMVMKNELEYCNNNNEDFLLTSAIENAIMGSYSKPTKKPVGKKPITKKGVKK